MAKVDPTRVYDPETDDQLDPVSPAHPLLPMELKVLEHWKAESPALVKAHRDPKQRLKLETLVRLKVHQALKDELTLRANGATMDEAMELTHPAMWTPPLAPNQRLSPRRTPKAKSPDTSA